MIRHKIWLFVLRSKNRQWFFHATRCKKIIFTTETYKRKAYPERLKSLMLSANRELFGDGNAVLMKKRNVPQEIKDLQEWIITHPPTPYPGADNPYIC